MRFWRTVSESVTVGENAAPLVDFSPEYQHVVKNIGVQYNLEPRGTEHTKSDP